MGDLSLSHIPTYFLSLFKFSSSVARKIEKLQRNFLWLRDKESKRIHLISWDLVCKSKVERGLGFGKVSLRNCALLGK